MSAASCRRSISRRESLLRKKRMSKTSSINSSKISNVTDNSPLLDIEKAEKLLVKGSLKFDFSSLPVTEVTEDTQTRLDKELIDVASNNDVETEKTPNSAKSEASDKEFLEFEANFAKESPRFSIHNLKRKTKNQKNQDRENELLQQIAALQDEEEQCFQNYVKQRLEIREKIHKLRILHKQEVGKENIDTLPENKNSMVTSSVNKNDDLRKNTLRKKFTNLTIFESPRQNNAVRIYNGLRKNSILCTPKFNKKRSDWSNIESSATRSLSKKVQSQCLLLQDTPRKS